ncbi:rhotekin [Alligator sinensis]|uniref:Rhotekin n=1 Tax=Alligator sinensis TaxID=38654 RepID=A0A3Q0FPT5_ALLSI|nr:rhotekin [Alligator sinensis]
MQDKLRILEDLNMLYIRQIALSLQDTDIQKKIDHEIRMREGACKLLAACSQREQALGGHQRLLGRSLQTLAGVGGRGMGAWHRSQLRVPRSPSDAGPTEERSPCRGRVCISDLRIPLMWKDTEYFKNKGDLHRCAVFCLLQIGVEIYDTEMVLVDRTLTDICFDNGVLFTEAGPDFELKVELFSAGLEEDSALGSTPKKLASKLSSSLGRSSGRRVRAALDGGPGSPVSNGGSGPLLLPAPSVAGVPPLPLPSEPTVFIWQQAGEPQSWARLYCVLRGTNLFCYRRPQDAEAHVEPAFTIAINKETRIRATEKDARSKLHSLSVTNRYGGEEVTHTLLAESRADVQRWMEAFWQQFYDMSQWKQCCDELMKIDVPAPRRPPALLAKQGSLYHEMGKGLGAGAREGGSPLCPSPSPFCRALTHPLLTACSRCLGTRAHSVRLSVCPSVTAAFLSVSPACPCPPLPASLCPSCLPPRSSSGGPGPATRSRRGAPAAG